MAAGLPGLPHVLYDHGHSNLGVKLIVNFSSHMGSFETMVENKIVALQGQSQATFELARVGYESLAKNMDNQSIEMARVITDARDSFEAIKQEMDAIK